MSGNVTGQLQEQKIESLLRQCTRRGRIQKKATDAIHDYRVVHKR